MKLLLLVLAGLTAAGSAPCCFAENMYHTHGHDFEYRNGGLFPVMWDLRSAWFQLKMYGDAYLSEGSSETYADSVLRGVLEEAGDSGINTILIRDEVRRDVTGGTDHLSQRAGLVRDMGFHVMLGGFRDVLEYHEYNLEVMEFLEDYLSAPADLPGDVIGIHGFDEIDGKYDGLPPGSARRDTLRSRLVRFHSWSNSPPVRRPFGSFMAKPAFHVPTLAGAHADLSTDFPHHTTFQLCALLDFPMLDWYPCRVWEERCNIPFHRYDLWGATDLLPAPASSGFYHAYTTRDELWAVDGLGTSRPVFRVFSVEDEDRIGVPRLVEDMDSRMEIGLDGYFLAASSDSRSSDIGDRSALEHRMNSAVVFYHRGGPAGQAQAVYHDGDRLVMEEMPISTSDAGTVLFCVGEDSYGTVLPADGGGGGIIGRGDLRVLWYGEDGSVSIFGPDRETGTGLEELAEMVYGGEFSPSGAVWGCFWNSGGGSRIHESGFVLYDDSGDYITVISEDGRGWRIFDDGGAPFGGLFGSRAGPGAVMAFRTMDWRPYLSASDVLVSIVQEDRTRHGRPLLQLTGGRQGYSFEPPGPSSEVYLEGMHPGSASSYTRLAFRRRGDEKLRVWAGGEGVETRFTSNFIDLSEVCAHRSAIGTTGSSWDVLGTMRLRYTRRQWVNAILFRNDEMGLRGGEIADGWYTGEANEASLDLFLDNLGSPGAGHPAAGHSQGAFDLEFQYGVSMTPGDNCLFANVQAFGRGIWGRFSPPPDTLLYMTVSPIIHGCRGISFYALDLAMMSGPAFPEGGSSLHRAPNPLLDWRPGIEGDDNSDIIGRVHEVAAVLTGSSGGPDYLSALVDHGSYTVLDTEHAMNGAPDEGLNFLALEENASGDILLMVANDLGLPPAHTGTIVFRKYRAADYGPAVHRGGWSGFAPAEGADGPDAQLALDFTSMPGHSVSLVSIPKN
ncbi:MAG: hypothetical protein R6U39_05565 [Candidatus Aegiribacteria sp.]